MRGRPNIPSALKILKGNPGRRALNSREPEVGPITELPAPPKYLGRIARTLWQVKGHQLIDAKMLTTLDLEALARWAQWQEVLIRASNKLNFDQLGTFASTNLLNTMSMASKAIRTLESEFGMTPASRVRVKVMNPKQSNLFDKFLDGDGEADGADPAGAAEPAGMRATLHSVSGD